MTSKENAMLQAFRTTALFFEDESDIVNASEVLKEDVATFATMVEAIEANITELLGLELVSGSDKQAFKRQLSLQTTKNLLKLKAHAIKTKNESLLSACQTSVTNLMNMEDDEFNRFMADIVKKMTANADVLAKYNVSESDRQDFATQVQKYSQLMLQKKVLDTKATVQAGNFSTLIKQTKDFVTDVLTIAVESVSKEFPDFVKAYNEVVAGRTPSVSSTQVVVKVIDAQSRAQLNKVTIEVEALDKSFTTDEDGRCVIKVGSWRELDFKISKSGWVSQTINLTKITRGRTRELNVQLVRAMVAEPVHS